MNYSLPLTIITPAYNRADCLMTLYNSLLSQTNHCFQWLIVDDGSTDNTEKVVSNMKRDIFVLDYIKKPNGGKHTALNYSHKYIKGEMTCIVDSDDWLITSAVEMIINDGEKYKNNEHLKMMTYLRGDRYYNPICDSFPKAPLISNHIDFRVNSKRRGDCFEIIDSDVFKEFPFPEHEGEKFLGEGFLWNNAGFKYDTIYIPKVIYICEYLDGGLTRSGRRLRIKCPLGGMDNSKSFFNMSSDRKVNKDILRKEALLYICYGKFASLNYHEICERLNLPIIKKYYILGCLLYYYWRFKYR